MTPLRVATLPALEAIPGLVHGFERRSGPAGHEARDASRARVAGALASQGRLMLLTQVHGRRVETAPWDGAPEADAGLVGRAGDIAGVETADCLPILLVDPKRRQAAAVHAGWRGTALGIAEQAVLALVAAGSPPEDLLAGLGPAIGPCCYEVGDELRPSFGSDADLIFSRGPRGRAHLDVPLANALQLARLGLRPENIHRVEECTYCRADLYHSYRREGKGAGRMINYVGWRA
jgi:YfiH family protein